MIDQSARLSAEISGGEGFRGFKSRDVVGAGALREFEKWIRECKRAPGKLACARSDSGGI